MFRSCNFFPSAIGQLGCGIRGVYTYIFICIYIYIPRMLEKTCEKEKNAIGALTCARTKDLSRSVLWQASMHAAAHCIDNAMTT